MAAPRTIHLRRGDSAACGARVVDVHRLTLSVAEVSCRNCLSSYAGRMAAGGERYPNPRRCRSPLRRFMALLDPQPSGCVLWTGATRGRYGEIMVRRARMGAHRFAYTAFVGEIPDGLIVRHHCDVPMCVNPDHLAIGTQADNINDMWSRGRQSPPPANDAYKNGNRQHWRRFADTKVDEVRRRLASGQSQRAIGQAVGMSQQHVSQIKRGIRRAGL